MAIRIDKRYSAALMVRWLRRCRAMGAQNFTNGFIRAKVVADYGW